MAVAHHFIIGASLTQQDLTPRNGLEDPLHLQQIMALQYFAFILCNNPLFPVNSCVGDVQAEINRLYNELFNMLGLLFLVPST